MAMTGGTAKLVKTTYPFSDKSKAVSLYVYYKTSQDVATNKSTVTVGMYVTTPSGWDIGSWTDYNGSYIGTTANTFNGTIPNFSGTRWLVENKTFTVEHNADGTGTATIYWKWGVNSPWGGYENPSGSFSITLPTIARATTPTLSATSVQMGKSITVTMNRASSAFTHKLKYTINGTTKDIASGLGTSYTWTVPDLVSLMPDATSGKATITCETYNGTAKVGSKTVSLTIKVYSASEPTLPDSAQMGKTITITTNRESSKYTHRIRYTIAGKTYTVKTGVGASVSWEIADHVDLIPNASSGTATVECTTYNGTATVGTTKKTITLTVPDASVPTAAATVVMGKELKVTLNSKSAKYSHKVQRAFNGKSEEVTAKAGVTYVNLPISLELAKEIPNATSGTVTVTCKTYNGTKLVGTETITATATVPDNDTTKPKFTMAFTPVHDLNSKYKDLYVQKKSKVKVTFTDKSEYSSIKSCSIKVMGATATGNPCTSALLTQSGEITVAGTVTDSRGYSRTVEEKITVTAYAAPALVPITGKSALVCTRSLNDGTVTLMGEYALIQAKGKCSSVEGLNSCSLSYRYKASSYGAWKELEGTEINKTLPETFNIKTSYVIQLRVQDDIGEEKIYSFTIPYISVPIHEGRYGRYLGLGQYCSYEHVDSIEVGWTTYFNTGIGRRVIFEPKSGDYTTGWTEGEALETVFPNADITMLNQYTMFLAIVESTEVGGTITYPVPCFRSENRIYGQFTVNLITTENIRSYALYMKYGEKDGVVTSLSLERSRYVTHISEGAHGPVTVLDDSGTSDIQKVRALYALL